MKKIGDIMKELGFSKDAPDSSKEAFIRHLLRQTMGVEPMPRQWSSAEHKRDKEKLSQIEITIIKEQLSFDDYVEQQDKLKKSS